jgi:hypothetical protein
MRTLPSVIIACALVAFPAWVGCADEAKDIDLTGRVGESCRSCDGCDTHLSREGCECSTCTKYGYDPDARLLLQCSGAVWTKDLDCPGGVSVECNPKGGSYRKIHCLDQNGNQIWQPD